MVLVGRLFEHTSNSRVFNALMPREKFYSDRENLEVGLARILVACLEWIWAVGHIFMLLNFSLGIKT